MHLTTPLEKVLCPYCFQKYHPSECNIFSEKDGTVVTPTGPQKLARKFFAQQLGGKNFDKRLRLQCPNCAHPWPKDIELADNYIIALVGGTGAGKSNYIAMAIDQLKHNNRIQNAIGVARIGALSSHIEARYNAFYESLIRDHKALPATQGAAQRGGGVTEPLIYRLDFLPGTEERRPVYLYLYDVAGEDIQDENNALDYSQFLFFANALVLLADPFAMPNMRRYIHPQYHPPILPTISPSDVLFRVVDLYQTRTRAKLSIPLAITISKSDLLQFADPGRHSSVFATPTYYDSRYTHRLQIQELDQVSGDVQKLLEVYGDAGLVTWTQQYEQVGFFAVSATGWPLDPATRTYPAIEPLRCLDPLLWVLYRLGVLQLE